MSDVRKLLTRKLLLVLLLAGVSLGCVVVGFAGVASPMNDNLAAALIWVGIVLVTFWLVIAKLLRTKVDLFDLFVCDEALLVRWTYPLDLWREWLVVEGKSKTEKFLREAKYVMTILAGVGLLIMIVGLVGGLSFGIALLLALGLLGTPLLIVIGMHLAQRLQYRRERKKPEIVLSKYGAVIGYALHSFFKKSKKGSIIRKVSIEDTFLEIECGWQTSNRHVPYEKRITRIPIPDNALEQAAQIADKLRVSFSYDMIQHIRLELRQRKRR